MSKFIFGISTSYFGACGMKIYDSVKTAHDWGFKWIEMGANHEYEEDVFEILERIKKDFPDIRFSVHCYFPPPFKKPFMSNTGNGPTDKNKLVIENILETARVLQAEIISFHAPMNAVFKFGGYFENFKGFKKFLVKKIVPPKKALANAHQFFDYLFKRIDQGTNLKVAIENIYVTPELVSGANYDTILKKASDFKEFFKDHSNLHFLFDQGHAFISRRKTEDFLSLKDRLVEIHVSGVDKNNCDHNPLNKDSQNTKELLSFLENTPHPLPLIFENTAQVTKEEILRQRNFLEEFFKAKKIDFE